jgi:hypothetical protein
MKRAAVSLGLRGLRPLADLRAAGVLMLLAVKRPKRRGRKGKRYPKRRNDFVKSVYTRLTGANNMARTNGTCVVTWLSGCGTTRGAGSIRMRRLEEVEERGVLNPFSNVSCLRGSRGGGASDVAAAAMGSSAGSPSKKRAIAICAD